MYGKNYKLQRITRSSEICDLHKLKNHVLLIYRLVFYKRNERTLQAEYSMELPRYEDADFRGLHNGMLPKIPPLTDQKIYKYLLLFDK